MRQDLLFLILSMIFLFLFYLLRRDRRKEYQSIEDYLRPDSHEKKDYLHDRINIARFKFGGYRSLPEIQAFTENLPAFKNLLKNASFAKEMDIFFPWIKSLAVYQYNFLIAFATVLIASYFSFLFSTRLTPSTLEAHLIILQIIAILSVFLTNVRPFLNLKRFKPMRAFIKRRYWFEKGTKLQLFSFFVLLLLILIRTLIKEREVLLSSYLCLVHLLILVFFSKRIIEKGSPFDPSTKSGILFNQALLLSKQHEITQKSARFIFIHALMIFFSGYEQIMSNYHMIYTSFLFLIMSMTYLQKEQKKKYDAIESLFIGGTNAH